MVTIKKKSQKKKINFPSHLQITRKATNFVVNVVKKVEI